LVGDVPRGALGALGEAEACLAAGGAGGTEVAVEEGARQAAGALGCVGCKAASAVGCRCAVCATLGEGVECVVVEEGGAEWADLAVAERVAGGVGPAAAVEHRVAEETGEAGEGLVGLAGGAGRLAGQLALKVLREEVARGALEASDRRAALAVAGAAQGGHAHIVLA
jgi:hypothetical protein